MLADQTPLYNDDHWLSKLIHEFESLSFLDPISDEEDLGEGQDSAGGKGNPKFL